MRAPPVPAGRSAVDRTTPKLPQPATRRHAERITEGSRPTGGPTPDGSTR
ncbi:hypothetical protein [Streptomyces cinereospinus]